MKPILYTSSYSDRHLTGSGHPESPLRLGILEELFQTTPFDDWPQKTATPATQNQIIRAHTQDYIFKLQDLVPDHGLATIDGDTVLSPDSYDAALHAAGAVCNAVDDVLNQESQKAFCAVRPPGHHAEPHTAMGFCLLNNIFIGARHAQEKHGIKKIAIVDFDVHHGNGTETMCGNHNVQTSDAPILYISSHGYPLFPMTGDPADNSDTLLNIRLPDGCASETFRDLYSAQVFPALEAFEPDLLMLSAGFDAHQNDPLAPINLTTEDYGWVTEELAKIAEKHAKGRIISVLEGGYDLIALKESVQAHLIALDSLAPSLPLEK